MTIEFKEKGSFGTGAGMYFTKEELANSDLFVQAFIKNLENYKKDKEAEGLIPTVELLIEDLKKSI